eukprot:TRINITY_DN48426_c0_g1_i6.p1 TRINITY_DN48426_c0_g1~~TRINITY_DN48426_c0_g1_i6.p1  ORF type:complete len:553 (-),score=58.75 TRINITY_DN48426_c0_g1_i6:195-1853(-)
MIVVNLVGEIQCSNQTSQSWWKQRVVGNYGAVRKLQINAISQYSPYIDPTYFEDPNQQIEEINEIIFEEKNEFTLALNRLSLYEQRQRVISHRIRSTLCPADLLYTLNIYINQMNAINTAVAVVIAARMLRPGRRKKYLTQEKQIIQTYTYLFDLIKLFSDQMDGWTVANCLWSLGKAAAILKLNENNKQFNQAFMSLCKQLEWVGEEMKAKDVSCVLWAMGKVNWMQQVHFNQMINFGMNLNDNDYSPQSVVIILWAMSQRSFLDVDSIAYYVRLAKLNLNRMLPRDIGQMLLALKRLRYFDHIFLSRIEQIVIDRAEEFDSRTISNVLFAFADLGLVRRNEVINSLVYAFLKLTEVKSQDVANIVYGLSILQAPPDIVQLVLDSFTQQRQKRIDSFKAQGYRQFRRAQQQYSIYEVNLELPQKFEKICILTNKKVAVDERNFRNKFRDEVFSVVKKRFPNASQNIIDYDGEVQINIEIKSAQTKLAVISCDYNCYTITEPRQLIGGVQAHIELIKGLGWKVIVVSQFEWYFKVYQQIILELIDQEMSVFA